MQPALTKHFLMEREFSNLVHFLYIFYDWRKPRHDRFDNCKHSQGFQTTVGVSAGLSDFHNMVLTSKKTTFPEFALKTMIYRDIKKLDKIFFKCDLNNRSKEADISKYEHFE